MKKLFLIFVIICFFSSFSNGQEDTYKVGEKMEYLIHYGLINGGTAYLELKRDTIAGKEVIHAVFDSHTTGIADVLFRVRDIYESFIDPKTQLPVKSIRNVTEGKYHRYNVVLFDHKSRADSSILTSDLTGKHVVVQNIHDIISCFYFFRKSIMAKNPDLKKGDMITIMTWFTDELYPIRLRFVGIEDVKTKGGKLSCYKFNPVTEKGRLFKDEDGATFWFSADKNFLPVKVRFDIFVGSFTVDLVSSDGLYEPLNIKAKND